MMTPEVTAHLVALNQAFYEQFGDSFSNSRARPQPGFTALLASLPAGELRVLDVGCGDGRFGRFLYHHTEAWRHNLESGGTSTIEQYVGVDFSESLLAIANALGRGKYYQRNLAEPNALEELGEFDVIACLAALHHIPGYENRLRLLKEIKAHLKPDGRIFLATWQFLASERQRRKLRDWAAVGLDPTTIEPGDYLLSWERDGQGLRYVALLDQTAVAQMAQEVGLAIEHQFLSDGREGNLSLYTILH